MQDLTRRQFIASSAVAGAAASLPVVRAADAKTQAWSGASGKSGNGMSFIHLFLPGGWPCNDLWDPKPYSPFRKGMRGSELTSTVETIGTWAPDIYVGEPLWDLAEDLHRATIVRSLTHEAQITDHHSAQQRMLAALSFDLSIREVLVDLGRARTEAATYPVPIRDAEQAVAVNIALGKPLPEAIKLVSQGARAVRVTLPFEAFHGFDTHESGGRKMVHFAAGFTTIVSNALRELKDANIFDRTILCISSEFNRTIAGRPAPGSDLNTGENLIINDERDYGFHAHFAEANSIVLFGGPFKRGFVYGKTGPKHPMRVVENPVTLADIHATIAVALGVTPREGRVIEDLFS